jgi:hypothetical protein
MWQITTKHFMFFHSQYVADHHQTLHVFPFTVCGRSPPNTSCTHPYMDKNTGDYQLVREKNNTYVNQSDMGNYWGII